ncbi:Protein of unknown function [Cotesia congregata]|uniref:Uncharacterized protein n=1 Tax=Cotesia congregata TaxID=51543 RepID=A0A8J2HHL7_COTCN|nr:Protein of unknown function [Cotesia congregata]
MSKRGRPPAIESQKIVEAILEQSKEIVCSRSGSIIDKNNTIWKKISGNLHNLITPHSLYAYVTDDRYELKRKLFDCEGINLDQSSNSVNSTTADESMNLSNNSDDCNTHENIKRTYVIYFTKEEFKALIITKTGKEKLDKDRKK